jgi:hypothetical protein
MLDHKPGLIINTPIRSPTMLESTVSPHDVIVYPDLHRMVLHQWSPDFRD